MDIKDRSVKLKTITLVCIVCRVYNAIGNTKVENLIVRKLPTYKCTSNETNCAAGKWQSDL